MFAFMLIMMSLASSFSITLWKCDRSTSESWSLDEISAAEDNEAETCNG